MDIVVVALWIGLIASGITIIELVFRTPSRVKLASSRLRQSGVIGLRRLRGVVPRWIFGRPVFSVGCFHYPPLSFRVAEAGPVEFDGPWPRLIREVARILDIEVKLCPDSASDFEKAGPMQADFVVGLFQTPHRFLTFDFSAPFHRIRLQGICKRGRPKISKEELCSGSLRIAVQAGEVGWEYVQDQLAHLPEGRVQTFTTPATFEVVDHLLSGNYHVAICDEVSCLTFLEDARNKRPRAPAGGFGFEVTG